MDYRRLFRWFVGSVIAVVLIARGLGWFHLNSLSLYATRLELGLVQQRAQGESLFSDEANVSCSTLCKERQLYQIGHVLAAMGSSELAREAFHQARTLDPRDQLAFFYEGRQLAELNDNEGALATWREGGVAAYFFAQGLSALQRHDLKVAKSQFEQVIAINPDNLDAQYRLGTVLLDLGQLTDAREKAQTILNLDPTFIWAYILMGNTFRLEQNYPAAVMWYSQLLEITAGKSLALTYLGITSIEQGDSQSALQYFSQVSPDSPYAPPGELSYWRGRAYLQAQQYVAAEREFAHAVEYAPNNMQFRLALAELYAQTNRIDDAMLAYRQVLQLEPGNEQAQAGLNHLNVGK
jgi:tetratricopeptide (TPR) repeat protein